MPAACLNIIHLPHRRDRFYCLQKELSEQQITNVKIWNRIPDKELPCRGISRAHKQIVSWAKQNKLEEVWIAEDDIEFSAPGAFDYFVSQKPDDFDIYLGGIIWGTIQEDHTVKDFAGATLYVASDRFYDTILNLPEDRDFDRAMAGMGKFIICEPMVACQHDGYSDNSRENMDFGPCRRRAKWFKQQIFPFPP